MNYDINEFLSMEKTEYMEHIWEDVEKKIGIVFPMDYKKFIDGLENEVINWEKAQAARKDTSSMAFAERDIAEHTRKTEYLPEVGKKSFVLGSGICLNMRHLDKIPAFYNPPGARGEDTFFSCALAEKGSRVLRVPTYHFHDCFLKFTGLMKDKFPKVLRRIALDDTGNTTSSLCSYGA